MLRQPLSRSTPSGRAWLDLRAKAVAEGRSTDELLVLYLLEAFLRRLATSEHRDPFVLKGGVLLAAFGERRPTSDADFEARRLDNDADTVAATVKGDRGAARRRRSRVRHRRRGVGGDP